MDRRSTQAKRATVAALLLTVAACASDEPAPAPAKTLDITNRCAAPIWVRFDDDPAAATETFADKPAASIATLAGYRTSVADADHDGVAIAVSATETDVGTIIQVRSAEPDRLEAVVEGDRCP